LAQPKTITALRSRGGGQVVVELDGAPWRTIPLEVALRAGLSPGAELDRARARVLGRELRRADALARAGRALRTRDRTSAELDHRLARTGVRPSERAEAIETLTRAGIVDDARAASHRAAALAERGRGDAAIRWELERAGLAPELIEGALAELPPERERADRVAAEAGRGRRVGPLLARRGFAPETVEDVLGADAGADTAGAVG
jgi:SOS response regulatory protein OraA/RecX